MSDRMMVGEWRALRRGKETQTAGGGRAGDSIGFIGEPKGVWDLGVWGSRGFQNNESRISIGHWLPNTDQRVSELK